MANSKTEKLIVGIVNVYTVIVGVFLVWGFSLQIIIKDVNFLTGISHSVASFFERLSGFIELVILDGFLMLPLMIAINVFNVWSLATDRQKNPIKSLQVTSIILLILGIFGFLTLALVAY